MSHNSHGRMARLLLCFCLSLVGLMTAQAREHGVRRPAPQDREFYATAPIQGEAEVAPAAAHGCFVSNSPMEATKGIRHWSPHC